MYIHIPFCARRCDYCAFSTWTDRHFLRSAYVDACIAHVRLVQSGVVEVVCPNGDTTSTTCQPGPPATLYVGGGTPSQLEPADLSRLLEAVERQPATEVTIEANPDDVTETWAGTARRAGATRISLGVQSLDPVVLGGLGRAHGATAVASAVAAIARAGIASYSVDLIYGGAGETAESWRATLQGVLDLDPPPQHVSAYALTVEAGTPLSRHPSRHPDEDEQASRYEIADTIFEAAGLRWYEISNWAKPGFECRHNMNYWAQGDYLAIGAAAHGHLAGTRFRNTTLPERYVEAIASGRSPVVWSETLAPAARELEALELALRTRAGVPRANLPIGDDPVLARLVQADGGGNLVLSRRGRLLANEVACRLSASPMPSSEPSPRAARRPGRPASPGESARSAETQRETV